jgi:Recombination endonuclease VII
MSTFWTCRRQTAGSICGKRNPGRKQKCVLCGGSRPVRRRAKHLVALEAPYEAYVALAGADRCGICLRPRSERDRRLQRDHDHKSGRPRGLLCVRCNRALPHWMTAEWLRAAADYLEQAA